MSLVSSEFLWNMDEVAILCFSAVYQLELSNLFLMTDNLIYRKPIMLICTSYLKQLFEECHNSSCISNFLFYYNKAFRLA